MQRDKGFIYNASLISLRQSRKKTGKVTLPGVKGRRSLLNIMRSA